VTPSKPNSLDCTGADYQRTTGERLFTQRHGR